MLTFKSVSEDFIATMDALREFVAGVGPVLVEGTREAARTANQAAAKFHVAMLLASENLETIDIPQESKAVLLEARRVLRDLAAGGKMTRPPEHLRRVVPIVFVNGKLETDWDDPRAPEVISLKRALDTKQKQLRLMYESTLMALTSRSEWLVAQLLHLFFRKYPQAAGMSEPFFSLDTLATLKTIEDAREVLLDHKVESIMRKPLDDWLRFFKEKPKLGMGYLTDKLRLAEVFERRNLVVHNGGRVNRKYFEQVDEDLRAGLELGTIIEVGPSYLNASIDLLEGQFVLLAAELWKKLEPADPDRGTLLMNVSVQRLREDRWNLARGFSQFVMNDKNEAEASRLSSQINYWQSFKWAGQYDEIRDEVEKSDFSAKGRVFQLAYATIRDDFVRCFELLPELLEGGELKKYQLMEWPLFRALRERPEFAPLAGFENGGKGAEPKVEPRNGDLKGKQTDSQDHELTN